MKNGMTVAIGTLHIVLLMVGITGGSVALAIGNRAQLVDGVIQIAGSYRTIRTAVLFRGAAAIGKSALITAFGIGSSSFYNVKAYMFFNSFYGNLVLASVIK